MCHYNRYNKQNEITLQIPIEIHNLSPSSQNDIKERFLSTQKVMYKVTSLEANILAAGKPEQHCNVCSSTAVALGQSQLHIPLQKTQGRPAFLGCGVNTCTVGPR